MDLAIVDTLTSQNNGVNYLLTNVDVSSRFVRDKTMKKMFAKDSLLSLKKVKLRKKKHSGKFLG